MTYAIIEMGGKQYRVEKGDSVLVDRVREDEGAKVTPRALLFADGKNAVMDGADLGKVKVEAVVAEHLKGEKIRVVQVPAEEALPKRQMGHRSLPDAPRDQGNQAGPAKAGGRVGERDGRSARRREAKDEADGT